MEVFEAIAQRHSYRAGFLDQPVPREDLRRIVQAGIQAPSGRNAQTTTFVIVDDPSLVQQIAEMEGANAAQRNAKAFICCVIDRQPEPTYEDLAFVVEDCAAATENMLLAITALGYASVWIDGALRRQGRAEAIGALLGVPEGKVVRILLPLGVPEETWPQREKRPFEERAWFNRYGAE
jgi:nitroreductase